jgi:hypothetical protein
LRTRLDDLLKLSVEVRELERNLVGLRLQAHPAASSSILPARKRDERLAIHL